MKAEKIPRKTVDALVALAASVAVERIKAGEGDDEDAELVSNSLEYFKDRKAGKIK